MMEMLLRMIVACTGRPRRFFLVLGGGTCLLLTVRSLPAAVFDYSAPLPGLTAQYAGGAVLLRVTDGLGTLHSVSIPSGATADLTTANGVAAWSSGPTIYYYTYDPSLTNFVGASAVTGETHDLLTVQGMVAWSSGSTEYYRVYDWVRSSWRSGSFAAGTAAGLQAADGVVSWSTSTGVYFRVYDVIRGTWNDASGPGPTSDLINTNGVVAWSSGGIVYYSVYDPRAAGWRNGNQSGATFDLHCANGVVAWSVNPNVYVRVYDPLRAKWMGDGLNTGYTADLGIQGSTVTWSTVGGGFVRGYNPLAGAWSGSSAVPLAVFTVSTTLSNAPFLTAFVDLSIGGSSWSWNFGDGLGSSRARSPYYRYTTFGRYTATLNVSGSVTNQVIVTDTVPPRGTNQINGGAALTTNPAVTLTLSATDNGGVVADMRLGNDGANWTAWEAFAATRAWTLAPGNGLKNVYAQFRDPAGNTSAPAVASIQLDTTLPPLLTFVSTNVGESAGTVTVAALLDHAAAQAVSVHYATADGTAQAGLDYTATAGMLVFPAGVTNASFPITILPDSAIELNETILINFSDPTNVVLGSPGTVTILDDETTQVSFASTNFTAAENSGSAVITVQLSAPSGKTVAVHYAALTNGTASAGSDYVPVAGVLLFAPGEITRTFSIPLIDDVLDELSETVPLVLDGLSNAVAAFPQNAVLTILDDDNPVVNFSRSIYEVYENTNVVGLDVWLSKPFGQDVRVNYSILGGTATPGTDYVAFNGTLTFLPGETNAQIFVTLINDAVAEDDETVHVKLLGVAAGSLGLRAEADVLVLDDDRPPRFVSSSLDAQRRFHATLRGAAGQRFRVEYSVNLAQWLPLLSLTNVTGAMEIVDPTPAASAGRVYRTALP